MLTQSPPQCLPLHGQDASSPAGPLAHVALTQVRYQVGNLALMLDLPLAWDVYRVHHRERNNELCSSAVKR